MHILVLAQFYPPRGSEGSGKHHDLVTSLLAEGHRVTVVTGRISYMTGRRFEDPPTELQSGQLRVLRLWSPPGYHASLFTRALGFLIFMLEAFVACLTLSRPDVVFVTSPPPTLALVGALIARLRRVRMVFEIRDMWAEDAIALGLVRNRLLIAVLRWCEHWIEQTADIVVPVTPGFVSRLEQRGVRPERIITIPNGVDLRLFRPDADGSGVINRLGLANKFVVLCSGALGLNNDLPTILSAAALLKAERDIVFVLVGDGNARAEAERVATEQELRNVLFVGWVPHQAVPSYLGAANAAICIAVSHSLNHVAFANRAFEAMAAARPLLCLIDGMLRRLVEEAAAGVFVQPGSGCDLARSVINLRDATIGERQAMGARGRRLVESQFSREESVARLKAAVLGRVVSSDVLLRPLDPGNASQSVEA
jgi:glycosyltransferase involved in cell wall biosynthesis